MTAKPTKMVGAHLPVALFNRLTNQSRKEGKSRGKIIAFLVKDYLDKIETKEGKK